MSSSDSTIPTVDFRDLASQSDGLLPASQDWGCFRLINHPIPPALMAEMKSTVRELFDQPPEIKRRNCDAIAGSGYVAPNKQNPLYEALGLYDVVSPEALDDFCSQLEASPSQRETIVKYSKAIHELAMAIGRGLCQTMGLLDTDFFDEWVCQFRINKYHFTPESVGSLGVQMHTDSSFLTILQDDEHVGGLEVMDKSGAFVAVDPLPGSLVVNFGDVAKVWSNGRFCNVKHRVQCREATTRISIAFFVLGPKEGVVEAPAQLLDAKNPRLYDPITVEDYRKLRLSTGLRAGEALALLGNIINSVN